jgi:hypothetical protein
MPRAHSLFVIVKVSTWFITASVKEGVTLRVKNIKEQNNQKKTVVFWVNYWGWVVAVGEKNKNP